MNEFIQDQDGRLRWMGVLPPHHDFGGLPKFKSATPSVPESAWREIDFSGLYAPVLNQEHNDCVNHGATTTFQRMWAIGGGTRHDFSPDYIYGYINGGRDNGAVISDAMNCLMQRGLCLASTVPEGMIYRQQFPANADAEAARFKVAKAYHCEDFGDICSAIQQGFMVAGSVRCGNNFVNLSSEGVAPVSRGPGNHCIAHCGMKKLGNGQWALITQNSWGTRFGINGFFLMAEAHYSQQSGVDAFCIQSVLDDPEEPASNLPLQVNS